MTLPFFSKFENPIKTDIHSHLLPNIDDGVKTIEETLIIARRFEALGYTKLITTPHVMGDVYCNETDTILQSLEMVRDAFERENISLEITASPEYYLDEHFLNLLKSGTLLPFSERYLLFETGYQSRPMILSEALFEIQSKGYIPVLAHPERYLYLHDDIEQYLELKSMGVLFQINVKSLKSHAPAVIKNLHKIIEHGLVDFIGSDAHRIKEIHDYEKLLQHKSYRNIFKKNRLLNNTLI